LVFGKGDLAGVAVPQLDPGLQNLPGSGGGIVDHPEEKLFPQGDQGGRHYKKLLSVWFQEYIMSSEIENKFLFELKHAALPLVELGLYDSPGEFIKDVTSDFIKHKIQFYKKQLKTFEKKYNMSFNALSKKLETGASIPEEDDWMEWEAADNMLKVWKKAAEETGICA
jgi:hypothetical protein